MRFRHQLAPRKMTFIKRHKGVIPIPIGGSLKGSSLAYGDWGLRIKGDGVRLSAKQLTSAEEVIKRKIKAVKGAKVYMRVFPDIPVCIKVCYFLNFNVAFSLTKPREMKPVWGRGRAHSNFGQPGMCLLGPLVRPLLNVAPSRVPTGRVIFEIGGAPVREELARDGAVVLLPD